MSSNKEEEKKIPEADNKRKGEIDHKKAADERKAAEIGVGILLGYKGEMSHVMELNLEGLPIDSYKTLYPFLDREEDEFEDEIKRDVSSYERKYDRKTDELVAAAGSDADRKSISAQRAADRARVIEDEERTIRFYENFTKQREVKRRIIAMDRIRPKPENVEAALRALNQLKGDINQVLSHIGPDMELDVGKANYTFKILTELEDQIKHEGSYTLETYYAFQSTIGKKLEPKWKSKLEALFSLINGESFTETPLQEFQRRLDREKKLDEEFDQKQ